MRPTLNRGSTTIPDEFDVQTADELWQACPPGKSVNERIEAVSAMLLHRPYKANPLVGSVDRDEVFVCNLAHFDCVTYCETVLAFALAGELGEITDVLRELRYGTGAVRWLDRNHYMSDWIEQNERKGLVCRVEAEGKLQEETRELAALAGFPPRTKKLRYFSTEAMHIVLPLLRTGDIVCFVSTRPELDFFHLGIIIRSHKCLLRHAAKSRGAVIEEPLSDFIRRNEMPGVIAVRPCSRNTHVDGSYGGAASST